MPLKTIKHNRGTYSGWKARSLAEAVAEASLLTVGVPIKINGERGMGNGDNCLVTNHITHAKFAMSAKSFCMLFTTLSTPSFREGTPKLITKPRCLSSKRR